MLKRLLRIAWVDAVRIVLLWLAAGGAALAFALVRGGHERFGTGVGLMLVGLGYGVVSFFISGGPSLRSTGGWMIGPGAKPVMHLADDIDGPPEHPNDVPMPGIGWGAPLFLAGVPLVVAGLLLQISQR